VSRNCGKCRGNIIYYKVVFQFVSCIRIPFYLLCPPDIIKCVSALNNDILPYFPHLLLLQLISLFFALEIPSENFILKGIRNLHLLPASVGIYCVLALVLKKVS